MAVWCHRVFYLDKIVYRRVFSLLPEIGGDWRMRKKVAAGLFFITVIMMLSGCGAGNNPEPALPVEVNRSYEKVDPSPAVVADFYDLRLKIDTETDRDGVF